MTDNGIEMKQLIIALCLLTVAACSPSTDKGERPNILLLSVDTLRADHMGCYGNDRWEISPSPNMDRLAERGVLFEQCYAPRGQTHPSIASMLTGKYPITHTLRENGHILPVMHRTIIQLLKGNGYATAAFAANFPTKQNPFKPKKSRDAWWTRGCDSFGDGFGGDYRAATILAPIEDQWTWDERTEKQALEWIHDFDQAAGSPFFLWVHFYDPHKPYLPHQSSPDLYPSYEGPLDPGVVKVEGVPRDQVTALINKATQSGEGLSEEDHKKVLALYDASQYGVDQRYDRILSALNDRGMLDNTWIFFTSDHGEELGEHKKYYYHGASIYNAVLRIPLIIVGPETDTNRRIDSLVQNLDLAPTILELAGITPLPGMEGFSLVEVLRGKTDATARDFAVAEWQEYIYTWFDGRYKYLFNPRGACPVKPPFMKVGGSFDYEKEELYDIKNDPTEQNNIVFENEDVAREMRKKLLDWIYLDQHQRSMKSSQTGDGTLEAIQALGYTGSTQDRRDVKFKN